MLLPGSIKKNHDDRALSFNSFFALGLGFSLFFLHLSSLKLAIPNDRFTGWIMQHVATIGNVTNKSCAGVTLCTSCHLNDLRHATTSREGMSAYYVMASREQRRKNGTSGRKCPVFGCKGYLMHKR